MTIARPMFPPRAESVHAFSEPAEGLSRRRLLAGAATLPVLGVVLPAGAEASPDPIFDVIARSREAWRISERAYDKKTELHKLAKELFGPADRAARNAFVDGILGGDQDDYTDAFAGDLWDSYEEFASTAPTTLAGLFAMLLYAEEVVIGRHDGDAFDGMDIFSAFAAAARTLGGRQA